MHEGYIEVFLPTKKCPIYSAAETNKLPQVISEVVVEEAN